MELKDTIELMTSGDYKARFIAEYEQAVIRIKKLMDFIEAIESGKVSVMYEDQKLLLGAQYGYMVGYIRVMQDRADEEDIDLPDFDDIDVPKELFSHKGNA